MPDTKEYELTNTRIKAFADGTFTLVLKTKTNDVLTFQITRALMLMTKIQIEDALYEFP